MSDGLHQNMCRFTTFCRRLQCGTRRDWRVWQLRIQIVTK